LPVVSRTTPCAFRTAQAVPRRKAKTIPHDFKEFVVELAGAFIRVSTDRIDEEINRWLERIVMAFGLDSSTIAEIGASDGWAVFSHGWPRVPKRRALDVNGLIPWTKTKMLAGETIVMASVDQLPDEAAIDRESMRRLGTKSSVIVPIEVGGLVVAGVGFGTLYHERSWSPEIVRRLQTMAGILGYALERKQSTTEVIRLRNELNHISRISTMGALTASLAHELNQPLGAILSNAQAARRLLAAKRPDLTEVDAAVEEIIGDNSRAVETIRNVRALFQRGEAQMSPVDLKQVVLDVERIIAADAVFKNISFHLDLPASLPTVIGNRTQLVQALMNLVLNAFEAVCEDGNGPREVEIRASQRETGRVHIAVRDTGVGIASQNMPKLFDAFFTTKTEGTGMGLAIVRSIVENHGGRLWAARNPDRGATLEFELPVKVNAESKN
jgi:signal transduction histidine kinase